jgi:hypothetical protein
MEFYLPLAAIGGAIALFMGSVIQGTVSLDAIASYDIRNIASDLSRCISDLSGYGDDHDLADPEMPEVTLTLLSTLAEIPF